MARPRAHKRATPQGKKARKENLAALSNEVLRLRLQALNLPIAGTRTQLLAALKRVLDVSTNPPAKSSRVAKHPRSRADKLKQTNVSDDQVSVADDHDDGGEDVSDTASSIDDKPLNQPPIRSPSVDDILGAADDGQSNSSPFTQAQLRAIQTTVQASISQAMSVSQIGPGTGTRRANLHPVVCPSGTASPLGLQRPLDKSLEDKILRGEYVDFTLLLPDSLAHPQPPRGSAPGRGLVPRLPCFPSHDGSQEKTRDRQFPQVAGRIHQLYARYRLRIPTTST